MKKASVVLIMLLAFTFACSGVQSVKPYELGKATAETLLYEARVAQNQGLMTADQFDQVRDVYDKLKAAQDVAIDARKAMIALGTVESETKATAAMNAVLQISTEMIGLAQSFGLMK